MTVPQQCRQQTGRGDNNPDTNSLNEANEAEQVPASPAVHSTHTV
jgi:hypothetical protein